MAAQGTSNSQVGAKRWVAIEDETIDNLNIDSDNDTGSYYFMVPAQVTRLGFLATTAVAVSDYVKVEVYRNGTGGTLLGTWSVCLTEGITVNEVAWAYAQVVDEDGEAAEDDTTRHVAPTKFDFAPGQYITLKVVEPADSGAGIAYIEIVEKPLHEDTTGVSTTGTVA